MAALAPEMDPVTVGPHICPIKCITDCASLYDTIHAVHLPTESRLVLDLSGVKGMLQEESPEVETAAGRSALPFAWCPTGYILADALTGRMDGSKLPESMCVRIVVMEQDPPARDTATTSFMAWIRAAHRRWLGVPTPPSPPYQ